MRKRILIIDDEESIRDSLAGILEDEGFFPIGASSAEKGLKLLENSEIDLILLDIWLGEGVDGLTALDQITTSHTVPVIMISGHGTIETAVKATKRGAFDFIEKPLSYDKVILSITNGLRFACLQEENRRLKEKAGSQSALIGESPVMVALKKQIEMVAPTDAWVLIRGDHGTGKELVAQAIHSSSQSHNHPMVEVNCAAIPEELIESELFGHEKGAFTGAHSNKRGKFDKADCGILFLDEIGDMSLNTQAKILRILQEQKFERVGGSKTIKVNVRVLAATNKDLEAEIEKGKFRADLFWRLNVVPINTPKLHQRREDIPLLVTHFLQLLSKKGLSKKSLTEEAFRALMEHSWPGNVRELRNFVERMVIMCQETVISAESIRILLDPEDKKININADQTAINPFLHNDFKTAKREFEREYLQQKLAANSNNISKTAEQVGLERSHLHKKLKGFEII